MSDGWLVAWGAFLIAAGVMAIVMRDRIAAEARERDRRNRERVPSWLGRAEGLNQRVLEHGSGLLLLLGVALALIGAIVVRAVL